MLTQNLIVPFILATLLWATSLRSPYGIVAGQEAIGRTYIVHVSNTQRPAIFTTAQDWYRSTLASVRGLAQLQDLAESQHEPIYSYGTILHGFAAKLTPAQAQALQTMQGVLSVTEDSILHLHTTRTPQFMGLNRMSGLWPASNYGDQVIIGVLDTGIWPERASFDDKMTGPIPVRWKGECEVTPDFNASVCNKKLIGARSFYKGYEAAAGPIDETLEYRSARDSEGHGTHTASTAAGNYVCNASFLGSASGTASGMAPLARIAAYKVCWKGGCFSSDILAAFEQAIMDGVDILSVSLGGSGFLDPITIGSFRAIEKGILVSASAGNGGPFFGSVANESPWLLTVGASTLDRNFPAIVKLSNNASYTGASLYNGHALGQTQVPLIYAGNAGFPGATNASVSLCLSGLVDPVRVNGKIVVCDQGGRTLRKGIVLKKAGAAGMILANGILNGEDLIVDPHVLPAVVVGYKAGVAIKDYIAKTQMPMTSIDFMGTILNVKPAPVMAAFSSRGPGILTLLKPDITAPGVNILAAWTSKVGPSEQPEDDRIVEFNILSGTSMSCPHVSGLAALLRGLHLDWSPAAIKSALMTTAFNLDNTGKILMDSVDSTTSTPFAFGSGHVNPVAALDPGIVYDLHAQDYVDFLCSLNISSRLLMLFTKGDYNCTHGNLDPNNLNYPSFSFVFSQGGNTSTYISKATRMATNVGLGNSTYTVTVSPPLGVSIKVEPTTLSFTRLNERKSYTVTCETSAKDLSPGEFEFGFGSIIWSDETHKVHSPIVFTWLSSLF